MIERLDQSDQSQTSFAPLPLAGGTWYAYRLGWMTASTAYVSPEVWVEVPQLRFALVGGSPNPSNRGLKISFSLPDAAPAQLRVFDILGRQMFSREVGSMGPGDHEFEVDRGLLSAGVYLVRLERGGQSLSAKSCVLR